MTPHSHPHRANSCKRLLFALPSSHVYGRIFPEKASLGQDGEAARTVNLTIVMESPVAQKTVLAVEFIDIPNWMDDGWQDLGNPYLSGGVAWESDNYGSISVGNEMTQTELIAVTGGVGTGSGRDIVINRTDYWTVRIVMVSKIDGYLLNPKEFPIPNASFPPGAHNGMLNTIIIMYERLKEVFPQTVPSNNNLEVAIRHALLHEIGHALMLDDAPNATEGVMKSPNSPTNTLHPDFQKFLLGDILKIQEESKIKEG